MMAVTYKQPCFDDLDWHGLETCRLFTAVTSIQHSKIVLQYYRGGGGASWGIEQAGGLSKQGDWGKQGAKQGD